MSKPIRRIKIEQPIILKRRMVGLGRLELPTPRLSSVCSNQLSYRPDLDKQKACDQYAHTGQRPSPVVRRPRGAPACHQTCGTARERKPMVHILMKKEKRSRRFSPYPWSAKQISGRITLRWSPDWRHLCSKKHGKVHTILDGRLTNSTASLERR